MRVHQICARLQKGDAITNNVLNLHRIFLSWGLESHIYAHENDPRMAVHNEGEGLYRRKYRREKGDLLLYHYSVYCENYRLFLASRNRKILVYHNITPPHFFAPYSRRIASFCEKGLRLLPRLKECDCAWGVSDFNRRDLVAAGFPPERTGVVPVCLDFSYLDEEEPGMRLRLRDGRWNILFVGRLVPNKRVDELLRFFAYYLHMVNPDARLMVIGASWVEDYTRELWRIIEEYRLAGSVILPGGPLGVSDRELASFYRSADVFMTMSEHEGFCVPLVESMLEGLPVVAFAAAAVPETLGGSGILFTRKVFPYVAEVVEELRLNAAFRDKIISGERRRCEAFLPGAAEARLRESLGPFLS